MGARLEVRREQFSLQAHFASPVFDLFKDFPSLVNHLFRTLGSYSLRLGDVRLDSSGESLGEVNLRLSWSELGTARLFLDRVELAASYTPFLGWEDGSLIPDLLGCVADYSAAISYRGFAVTQEMHGVLSIPPMEFLRRFASAPPQSLGPPLGSGTVFYFGSSGDRLGGSVALDLSRLVEGGLFLKLIVIYDATQTQAADLLRISRSQLTSLASEIGLDLGGHRHELSTGRS
jgi:hypothetical protein